MRKKETLVDNTNNFYALFAYDMLTNAQKANLDVPGKIHVQSYAARQAIQEIENQGGLWTRFREEYGDLYFAIQTQINRRSGYYRDHSVFIAKIVKEGIRDAQMEQDLTAQDEALSRRMTPMITYAFDLLVRWGANPSKLRV